jgi:Zn-dependent protease with chaperone function
MQQELIHHKEVDTLRVALLGFSIISIIVLFFIVVYIGLQYAMTFEEFPPDTSEISRALVNLFRILLTFVLLVPLIISFVIWVLTPSFVKYWYNLSSLPSEYIYIHDFVQEIALKMGILPPKILYTQKGVTNCFNLGKTESDSTIVISKRLADTLKVDELKSVLIHEIAHTKNRDVTLMAYFSAVKRVIIFLPLLVLAGFVCAPVYIGESPVIYVDAPDIVAFFLVFFGYLTFVCILIILGIQWFSRVREGAADARVSLFIDKTILKRTLYKLASVRSMRMVFVSSSLMISGSRKGGILSSHPALHERYFDLDKKKYIIDTGNIPCAFYFSTALSIFVFTLFLRTVFAGFGLFILPLLNWSTIIAYLFPFITGGILEFYYSYLSLKNIGFIIIFFTVISSVLLFGLMIFAYTSYLTFSDPPVYIPPTFIGTMDATGIKINVDWIATIAFFLRQRVLFGILTFLVVALLRIIKKI